MTYVFAKLGENLVRSMMGHIEDFVMTEGLSKASTLVKSREAGLAHISSATITLRSHLTISSYFEPKYLCAITERNIC